MVGHRLTLAEALGHRSTLPTARFLSALMVGKHAPVRLPRTPDDTEGQMAGSVLIATSGEVTSDTAHYGT